LQDKQQNVHNSENNTRQSGKQGPQRS